MGMKGKLLTVLAVAGVAAVVAVGGAGGAVQADPGITANSVTIGGTFPLTGVASLYRTIPAAAKAYFDYINDAKGGVNGRKINFIIKDDAYNPAQTVPLIQQLVESDKVFATVGNLGTAPGLATWDYLNKNKVPQLFVSTGDSYWGFCAYRKCGGRTHPYTIGWLPSYPGEAKQYGKYIVSNTPGAKVGVLYQNDAFGKNYFAGLRVGMGAKKSQIVDAESYDATQTNLTQQILALKSKGADTLVIFSLPGQAITAMVTAKNVGWSPQIFLGNVAANRIFLLSAAAAGANVDGVISSTYLKSATVNKTDPGMALIGQILDKYASTLRASFDRGDSNVVYGMGFAATFVQALQKAGKNPTRASLMNAIHNMEYKNPFTYPGIVLKTSAAKKDNFPLEQLTMIKWSGGAGGDWAPFGKLLSGIR